MKRPPTPRALVRLVGDELHDERPPGTSAPSEAARAPCWSRRRRRPCGHGGRLSRDRRVARTRAAAGAIPSATGYGSGCGLVRRGRHAPRRRARGRCRNAASAGAWLAGPPTSGGQIPETTRTFTETRRAARTRARGERGDLGANADEQRRPRRARTRPPRRARRPRPRSRPTRRRAARRAAAAPRPRGRGRRRAVRGRPIVTGTTSSSRARAGAHRRRGRSWRRRPRR